MPPSEVKFSQLPLHLRLNAVAQSPEIADVEGRPVREFFWRTKHLWLVVPFHGLSLRNPFLPPWRWFVFRCGLARASGVWVPGLLVVFTRHGLRSLRRRNVDAFVEFTASYGCRRICLRWSPGFSHLAANSNAGPSWAHRSEVQRPSKTHPSLGREWHDARR